MEHIDFSHTRITGGFWAARQETNRSATLWAVYHRFQETKRFEALKCDIRNGKSDIFWDSDVAKWMEGAAYLLNDGEDEQITAAIESAIDCIIENSDPNGYFNSHYLVTEQDQRFQHRSCHELYCAGHLFEAAIAYYEITGRDRFLKAMRRFADYIERVFKTEKSAAFITPGHPEIELALMRLAKITGETRYAELAKYFIDEHGKHPEEGNFYPKWFNEYYNQDEMPLRDRSTAEGHCVRALYLLCGAADVALAYGDDALRRACERCFDNIVQKRMYLTGGVGSSHIGETFTIDYDLPNRTAYTETCAAIALAMFANRMLGFGADSKYADIVERALYNGVMSGVSMDGQAFFYENPLEIDPDFNHVNVSSLEKERFPITQRVAVFSCSCCPPNLLRFIASIAGYLYTADEDTVYVHQYMNSQTSAGDIEIAQEIAYPENGRVRIICNAQKKRVALRIPGWCRSFRLSAPYEIRNGYAYIELHGRTEIELELDMPVRVIAANRRVHADAGRVAVMRGPVVYCAEGVDNGPDLRSVALDLNAAFEAVPGPFLLPNLKTVAWRPKATDALYYEAGEDYEAVPLTLIPYYAFANRGETEMQVWLLRK